MPFYKTNPFLTVLFMRKKIQFIYLNLTLTCRQKQGLQSNRYTLNAFQNCIRAVLLLSWRYNVQVWHGNWERSGNVTCQFSGVIAETWFPPICEKLWILMDMDNHTQVFWQRKNVTNKKKKSSNTKQGKLNKRRKKLEEIQDICYKFQDKRLVSIQ